MTLPALWMEGLSPEMVKMAEEELGENAEVKERALLEIRKLINEEPGLEAITEDFFLLRFLRMKKFDVKLAFNTLRNYHSYKAKHSGVVSDLPARDFLAILEMNKFIIAPKRHSSGGGVIYMALGSIDLNVVSLERLTAAILTALDVVLCVEATQVCGMSFIVDFAGMTWRILGQVFRPSYLMAAIQAIADTWPCRIKEFQIVNEPSYYKTMHNTFARPLMPTKTRDRLNFLGSNYEDLHRRFPLACLPECIGGTLSENDYAEFRREMANRSDLVDRLNRYSFKGKSYPADS